MKKSNVHSGFSLIEVIVALLISSALLVSLYQIYRRVQRSVISINDVIDIDTPLMAMYNQLETDITGMIVPASYKAELKALQEKEKANEQTKKTVAQRAKESTPPKKIENVFSYSDSDNSFKLTFLTTGGIKAIDTTTDSGGQTTATLALKPYTKRVFYSLEPDTDNPDTFLLLWAQSENIDDTAAAKKFELGWDIKELTMSFSLYDIPAKDSKAKPTLVTLTSFNPKEVFEKYKTYVPAYIMVKGIIVDQRNVREQDFAFEFRVPAYTLPEVEKAQEPEGPQAVEKTQKQSSSDASSKPVPSKPAPANAEPAAKQNTTIAYNTQKQVFKL